jgi:hypothetical protein
VLADEQGTGGHPREVIISGAVDGTVSVSRLGRLRPIRNFVPRLARE